MARRIDIDNPGPLTPAVLHVLLALADGAQHGYAIMQSVECTGGPAMGPGTIYGSLQRMEAAGLVRETHREAGARGRRCYELTEAGTDALRREGLRLDRIARWMRAHDLVSAGGSE